jgi:hypothetical protein
MSNAELDADFAVLFAQANQDRVNFLRSQTPANLQPYLNYYFGVPPAAVVNSLYANVTAAAVVKGSPGKAIRVMVVTPGTGANFTLNNCATVGAATAGNKVIDFLASGLFAGQIIEVQFVCDTGIVVSSCPTGGQFTVEYT